MSIAIHWFRRDLRLADNSALTAAMAAHDEIVPVYVASQWQGSHHWCGYPRQAFLCGCLQALDRDLRRKGGRLIIRKGNAVSVLEELARETGAVAIHFNRDPDPHGRRVEAAVSKMANRCALAVVACKDHALHERDEVLTASGTPFRVFTPYARAWTKLEKASPEPNIRRVTVPPTIGSAPLPVPEDWGLQGASEIIKPGESAARDRLEAFLDGPILRYGQTRDMPGEDATSRLSQDLRHGTLSIRELYARCKSAAREARGIAAKKSVSTFVNELIWREFYFQVLWHCPEVLEHEFIPGCRRLAWRARWRPEDEDAWAADPRARDEFDRWRNGQTGFPIVDAGMRQLRATGFMHNRARMITAMFLAKDLHLWWMHGEAHFMQQLVDGEVASNNGGWQWSASTGTDAAPYFRIQNPWSQTKRFDPEGTYIKRWIPELRDVPGTRLCHPPDPGTSLARGYPAPMLDHAAAREDALALFTRARRD